jgi:hypothetical protein
VIGGYQVAKEQTVLHVQRYQASETWCHMPITAGYVTGGIGRHGLAERPDVVTCGACKGAIHDCHKALTPWVNEWYPKGGA